MTAAVSPVADPRLARRARDMRRWKRRSVLIAALRLVLPLSIVVLGGGFAAWVLLGGVLARGHAGGEQPPQSIHMSNARFLGRDEKGHAYILTSSQAARDDIDMQRIMLEHPSLTMDADTPNPTILTADSGVYREDNRILMLNGHVLLHDAVGDAFRTDQATVDTVKGAVAGKAAVISKGPQGGITADSYAVYDKGQRVVFQGKVHSRINAH